MATPTSPWARALHDALVADPSTSVILEGEPAGWGSLLGPTHPSVQWLPCADRARVALATGRALAGQRVVVRLSSTGRGLAVLEALAEAARFALSGWQVPLVVWMPYGGEAGAIVDAPLLDALAGIEGLTVRVGGADPSASVQGALQGAGPVVFLEPREPVVTAQAGANAHVQLVSWAGGLRLAQEAQHRLAAEGIVADVVGLEQLWPVVPQDAAAASASGRTVVVAPAGDERFGARWAKLAAASAFWSQEAPPQSTASSLSQVLSVTRQVLTP